MSEKSKKSKLKIDNKFEKAINILVNTKPISNKELVKKQKRSKSK